MGHLYLHSAPSTNKQATQAHQQTGSHVKLAPTATYTPLECHAHRLPLSAGRHRQVAALLIHKAVG